MNFEAIENIHNNLVNGNRRDCVRLINEYGLYDFFDDYRKYLQDTYGDRKEEYIFFQDMTISFFRITNR